MTKRQIIVSLVSTLLLALVGALAFNKLKSNKKSTVKDGPIKQELIYVNTANFDIQSIQSTIEIDGRVNAYEKINLSAEANGKLLSTDKTWRTGSYFTKGDLLFQVDATDERLSLFAQRSSLMNAITQIMPDLKFDYPDAFLNWKKYLDDFDIERNTPDLPKATSQPEKYYVAGKNIYNLFYAIKSAEEKINNHVVYAPFSGVFTTVNAYPGSLVSPGTVLGSIMNTGRYELQTPITSSNLGFVRIGQKVMLQEEGSDQKYKGTISRIGKQIDQTTQSIPTYISVSGKGLRDGMYLKGKLNGNTIPDVTELPADAIVNQNKIYVLRDSLIVEKEIQIMLPTDDKAIVRGVEITDKVIVKSLNSLSPGQKAVAIKR